MRDSSQPRPARPRWSDLLRVGVILLGPVIVLAPLLAPHPEVLTSPGAPLLWLLIGLVFVLIGIMEVQSRHQPGATSSNAATQSPPRTESTGRTVLLLGTNMAGVMAAAHFLTENGFNVWWLILAICNILAVLLTLRDLVGKWRRAG